MTLRVRRFVAKVLVGLETLESIWTCVTDEEHAQIETEVTRIRAFLSARLQRRVRAAELDLTRVEGQRGYL